jgi:DNA-binding FrmR family transcriptional regulator/copper chaperone CopZ
MSPELTAKQHAALEHVNAVRGQLDEVTRMLESDAYCVEVMKQIQKVQCSLERANHVTLHKHLQTCFSDAVFYGRGQAAIDELLDAMKFTPAMTGPPAQPNRSATGHDMPSDTKQFLASTTFSLPGISSQMCKAAIEGIVAPIAGVGSVDVDVSTKTVTIYHDNRAPARRLVDAIEDQGCHVAETWITAAGARANASRLVPGEHDAVRAGVGFLDGDGI